MLRSRSIQFICFLEAEAVAYLDTAADESGSHRLQTGFSRTMSAASTSAARSNRFGSFLPPNIGASSPLRVEGLTAESRTRGDALSSEVQYIGKDVSRNSTSTIQGLLCSCIQMLSSHTLGKQPDPGILRIFEKRL